MIANIRRNCLGTMSFDARFPGMRKPADFVTYPVPAGTAPSRIVVQSDTRIGTIDLQTGAVHLSPPRAGGAGFVHLRGAAECTRLDAETLLMLKAGLVATAERQRGAVVQVDNAGAAAALTVTRPAANDA